MKLFNLRTKTNSRPEMGANADARGVLGGWPSFTGALLCLGVGGAVCGLLALGSASPLPIQAGWRALMAEMGGNGRMPKNQLQADARTFAAAVSYLLEPEPKLAVAHDTAYHIWEPPMIDPQPVTAAVLLASNTSRL